MEIYRGDISKGKGFSTWGVALVQKGIDRKLHLDEIIIVSRVNGPRKNASATELKKVRKETRSLIVLEQNFHRKSFPSPLRGIINDRGGIN